MKRHLKRFNMISHPNQPHLIPSHSILCQVLFLYVFVCKCLPGGGTQELQLSSLWIRAHQGGQFFSIQVQEACFKHIWDPVHIRTPGMTHEPLTGLWLKISAFNNHARCFFLYSLPTPPTPPFPPLTPGRPPLLLQFFSPQIIEILDL